jgi:peptidoglycan-associated lipoprotein
MREQKRILHNGLKFLAVAFLVSCGNPVNPPPPKWTGENLPAEKPTPAAPKPPPPPAPKTSLDELQTGKQAAASPLNDIHFNFDSAALSDSARATLRANADWLKANATARIQIEGHCDERGAADYNMALGAKRAQAALDYLATLGITAGRMSTISYGEEIPVCKEKTEACWAQNRRDRFVVTAAK